MPVKVFSVWLRFVRLGHPIFCYYICRENYIRYMKKIAPSILSADFSELKDEIRKAEQGGAELLHLDVMDGHFVPNITFGPFIVEAVRRITDISLDVHLMIEQPELYINNFADAGADIITVHAEASPHLHRLVQQIKAKDVKAGVALNPHTPLQILENILPDIDMVLIMTVNPGFGGQAFIPQSLQKIRKLKEMLKNHNCENILTEADGGIKLDNIREISDAGCDIFVSGSGIFKAENPAETIDEMLKLINT